MSQTSDNPILILLVLLSIAYVLIIYVRGVLFFVRRYRLDVNRYAVVVLTVFVTILVTILLLMGSGSLGLSAAAASILAGSIILTLLTFLFGGMASGAIMRAGASPLSTILLLAAQLALIFIEPWIVAPISIGLAGWNLYQDYHSYYGMVSARLSRNELLSEIFVFLL